MPDYHGRFSDDEKSVISDWLAKNWTRNRTCPISGHNQWTFADYLVTAPVHSGMSYLGGPSYPAVLVTCDNCGYTMLFNAVIMGIVAGEGARGG